MKNWYSKSALVLLAVLFLALTMLSNALLTSARLDLTEQRLFTLSPGTLNLLREIEEPVTIEFFFSEGASSELPMVRNFARRVQELLDEMARRADGGLVVRRIDPRPFSDEEDRAVLLGLQGIPVGSAAETLYLGIVGTNLLDGREVLPFVSPAREAFLEYELARMIFILSQPTLPRVGLLSGLPMSGGFDFQSGRSLEPWAIYNEITDLFEVESIDLDASALPAALDVLVLVHPRGLGEDLLADIERFTLAGGRLLAFLDPHAEADPGPDPMDPMGALTADVYSTLEPLLRSWGVEFSVEDFVVDQGLALQVAVQQGQAPVRHPGILGVTASHMNREDVITGELEVVNMSSVGWFALDADSPLSMQPLLFSSRSSDTLDTERLRFLTDPSLLADEMGNTGVRHVIAARFSGEVEPVLSAGQNGAQPGQLNAILVADTDLLSDRFWVQRQRFFGTTLLDPFANNADFVINAIDNLLGNADLISVRSRGTSLRPFTLVDELRRSAEQRLRSTEQRLEVELAETERRLGELQEARGDADLSVLTAEQEAEIDRFIAERVALRQQLRQVRRDLDRDIEALGVRVKLINIAMMPIAITLFALFLSWRRRSAFKRRQEGAGS
ncbi:MAG: Gldg family protein [Wenzhouxiangella sp.]